MGSKISSFVHVSCHVLLGCACWQSGLIAAEAAKPPVSEKPPATSGRTTAPDSHSRPDVQTKKRVPLRDVRTGYAGHFSCSCFSGVDRRLCIAASDEEAAEFRKLLDAGADVEARSKCGETRDMTLLILAVWHKWDMGVVKLLLDAGADVGAEDALGNSALIYAAESKLKISARLVEMLIAAGADVNAAGENGVTALMHASTHDHVDAAAALVKAGARIDAKDDAGWTPLMHATRKKYGNPQVVQFLIRAGANVNAAHQYGGTALSSACYNGHTQAAQLLIDAGADVNAEDKAGWTSLICAAMNGHTEIVKLLLAAGADVHAEDKLGRTALFAAASNNHAETVKVLMENGGK